MRPTLLTLEDRRLLSTFPVTSTGDDVNTTGTLRWAVAQADAASSPSTIDFNLGTSPATITLSNGVLDLSNTSAAITITGPGANLLSISGNKASGVFQVDGGVAASISGLTITGGSAQYAGGGLYNNGGTVSLTDSTVSGNSAAYRGGGLDNKGTATLNGCTISGNSAPGQGNGFGGGLYNRGTATLTGCTISGNSAAEGGGLANYDGGTANLTDCTIFGNSVSGNGGGLFNKGQTTATLTLTGCTITGNSAPSNGGGLQSYNTATLTGCTISGNSALFEGGFESLGTATLTACTISGNSATGDVGGLGEYRGTATLTDTIIAGNTGPISSLSDISGNGTVIGSNNLIGTGGSGGLTGGTNGNIVLTDLTTLGVAPLGDYGGPTQTMALLPGSAAIGAGKAVNGVTTDQRGEPLDSTPDIGAFQSQGFTLTVDGGTGQTSPFSVAFANPLTVLIKANNAVEPVAGGCRDVHGQRERRRSRGGPLRLARGDRVRRHSLGHRHGQFRHRLLLRRGVDAGSRRRGRLQPDEHEGNARGHCLRR